MYNKSIQQGDWHLSGIDRFPKKVCKFCNTTGHFPYQCRANPKVVLKRKVGIKRTPVKKIGKNTKQWLVTRATWFRKNPPDADGYWYCYLGISEWCPGKLTIEMVTLDHVVPRSRAPELRFSQDNIKPCCSYCNNQKGSKTLDKVKPE